MSNLFTIPIHTLMPKQSFLLPGMRTYDFKDISHNDLKFLTLLLQQIAVTMPKGTYSYMPL